MNDHLNDQFKPNTTVAAVIRYDDKYLLVEEIDNGVTVYNQPAGHVEANENLIDAVKREVKEETGLDIMPKFFNYFNEFCEEHDWHAVVLIFYAKGRGEAKKDGKEIQELGWFDKEQIFNLKLAFEHKKVLEEYFKKKAYLL